ncbi:DUF6378 domain-containing protein [Haloarcula sp. S1CR25-12]|uniref:DUF6378 domain-containing protein n=1 Tax=Haloarcula saliterrae TaxID=2950534 RepID=A0ABU2F8D1_9EURY|nr:DUF6378 domain-containing protein [Haloarcula sp. S1CR25-12]MDS0258533.1 DUF6378 domain-containing protein [Haloarcula sp. S1CR25-12]
MASDEPTNREMPSGDALAGGLLEDTVDLVTESRDSHGDAVENQEHIAHAWAWYLRGHGLIGPEAELTGADVARMMQLVKLSRGAVGEYDVDHDRDVAGYAGIAAACETVDGNADVEEVMPDGE